LEWRERQKEEGTRKKKEEEEGRRRKKKEEGDTGGTIRDAGIERMDKKRDWKQVGSGEGWE